MDYSDAVLGGYAARKLREKNGAPVLIIGADRFTRRDLAGVECFNFVAAANLSTALNNGLQVKNTREVYKRIAPAALALPRIGIIALAVLGAAFQAKGLGGDAPLEQWCQRHLAKDETLVAFSSIKLAARAHTDTNKKRGPKWRRRAPNRSKRGS